MTDLSKFFGFARYRRMPSVECTSCDWYRRVGNAGSVCDMHEALATLAHNIAWAASLRLAYEGGVRDGYLRSAL